MNIIKPNKLNIGDTISIIAPSGVVDFEKIQKAKNYFEDLGFCVKFGENIQKSQNYLAGDDKDRLADLHNAFADKNVKAIICARGGYGALRLADDIDFELIKNNPKIFCGYSDITILNALLLKKSGLISFSGAMAQSDFGNDICEYTKDQFINAVTGKKLKFIPNNPKIYYSGNAKGLLFGGNLATIVSLCGSDFIPNQDFIFFAEDLNEPVYKIDKYFTQLLRIKDFKTNIKAIILGDFLDIDNQKFFDDYFKDLGENLNIPIISGYPISHSKTKATIPYGAIAELNDLKLLVSDYLV